MPTPVAAKVHAIRAAVNNGRIDDRIIEQALTLCTRIMEHREVKDHDWQWFEEVYQHVSNGQALPTATVCQTGRRNLPAELRALIPNLPERDRRFAASLCDAFDHYGRLTARQQPHFDRLLKAAKCGPVASVPSLMDEQVAKLRAGVASLPEKDRRFALSLCDAHAAYGRLTERQQPYFDKLLVKLEQPAPATEEAMVLPTIARLFQPGGLAMMKWNGWKLKPAPERATTWIRFNGIVVAKMDSSGRVTRTHKGTGCDLSPLKALDANPREQLAAEGLNSGICACCGRELTDPESIARGIGPICWGRFGEAF